MSSPAVGTPLSDIVGTRPVIVGEGFAKPIMDLMGYDATQRPLAADHGPEIAPDMDVAAKAQTFMKSFDI